MTERAADLSEATAFRQRVITRAARVVVKVGSSVLTRPSGGLDPAVFQRLAREVAALHRQGREVVIVSSGAIAAGRQRLSLAGAPDSLPEKQAAAAVGQSALMQMYERAFGPRRRRVAQLLLTHADLGDRRRFLNARHTLTTLLRHGVVPVVNENDTVVVEEIQLGDNDNLSAMVASLVDADLLVILTDTAGLYGEDPRLAPGAEMIPVVTRIDAKVLESARRTGSRTGVGGMATKLAAAASLLRLGVPTIIADGRAPGVLSAIVAGDPVGTLVLPRGARLPHRKHWIGYVVRPQGTITVDDGAVQALTLRGKSLLPSGIVMVRGRFRVGDAVDVADGRGIVVARGLTNYSAEDVAKIQGLNSSQIRDVLGVKDYDEVIHRDDLVLLPPPGPAPGDDSP